MICFTMVIMMMMMMITQIVRARETERESDEDRERATRENVQSMLVTSSKMYVDKTVSLSYL